MVTKIQTSDPLIYSREGITCQSRYCVACITVANILNRTTVDNRIRLFVDTWTKTYSMQTDCKYCSQQRGWGGSFYTNIQLTLQQEDRLSWHN